MAAGPWLDMFSIDIFSAQKNYKVLFSATPTERSDDNYFYIVDNAVSKNSTVVRLDHTRMIFVDGSEKTKTIEFCAYLISELASRGATRKSTLVAIGGGSVQDAVTLTASLYMRGIPWHFFPTTLMAMTDSCVGGKSAINVGKYKNLAGNFYPPDEIRIIKSFINSLPPSSISAGLCEAVKIQIAKGTDSFNEFHILHNTYLSTPSDTLLIEVVKMALNSKKWFIEIDEFDKKERQLLNYGHSFGHALESASRMTVPHGLAVGVGMLVANLMVPVNDYLKSINQVINLLLRDANFDFASLEIDLEIFKEALKMDKKNSNVQQRLVLMNSQNQLQLMEFDLSEARIEDQKSALLIVLNQLGRKS